MIDHIRVAGLQSVHDVELSRLGTVNVICGKNNSGKSTLLQTLEQDEGVSSGITVRTETVEIATNGLAPSLLRKGQDELVPFHREILQRVLQSRERWFSNQGQDFIDLVTGELSRFSRRDLLPVSTFDKAFRALFPQRWTRVLLPAKRRLEDSLVVSTSQRVLPDGTGILNFLFYAKNQPPGEPLHVIYSQLRGAFKEIFGACDFDVFLTAENRLTLRFKPNDSTWLPAALCGLGLQEILILLYFAVVGVFSKSRSRTLARAMTLDELTDTDLISFLQDALRIVHTSDKPAAD